MGGVAVQVVGVVAGHVGPGGSGGGVGFGGGVKALRGVGVGPSGAGIAPIDAVRAGLADEAFVSILVAAAKQVPVTRINDVGAGGQVVLGIAPDFLCFGVARITGGVIAG